MHVSGGDRHGERLRRPGVVLLAVVALLVLVAIASTGSTPGGSGVARRPAEELVDTLVSLVLVLVLAGSGLMLYVYYMQRVAAHEERRAGRSATNRVAMLSLIAVAVFVLSLAVRVALDNGHHNRTGAITGRGGLPRNQLADARGGYEPRFATVPVIVILGVVGIAVAAIYLSDRARLRALPPLEREASLELALADVLGETLDDLRQEPDPRKAVVAAYARLERTFAAYGLPRHPAEAPQEYLHRILVDLDVGASSARRLTDLFAEAKFSRHRVGPETKDEAIELLESIRADLLSAEAARREAQASATTEPAPA